MQIYVTLLSLKFLLLYHRSTSLHGWLSLTFQNNQNNTYQCILRLQTHKCLETAKGKGAFWSHTIILNRSHSQVCVYIEKELAVRYAWVHTCTRHVQHKIVEATLTWSSNFIHILLSYSAHNMKRRSQPSLLTCVNSVLWIYHSNPPSDYAAFLYLHMWHIEWVTERKLVIEINTKILYIELILLLEEYVHIWLILIDMCWRQKQYGWPCFGHASL